MTVIAYKDGVIASDSWVTCGNIVVCSTQKLARMPCGGLVGVSSSSFDGGAFLRWCEGGRLDSAKPTLKSLSALVIEADGSPRFYDESLHWHGAIGLHFADGSAHQIALAAMDLGASADEAVAIAIERDIYCGGKIQRMELAGFTRL